MKANKYIYTAIKQNYTAIRLGFLFQTKLCTIKYLLAYTDTCMPPSQTDISILPPLRASKNPGGASHTASLPSTQVVRVPNDL
jgi:hypothetical protein